MTRQLGMMKTVLFLNTLLEGFIGFLLVFNPIFLANYWEMNAVTLYMTRMYGFAAITISVLSLLVLFQFSVQEVLVTGLLLLSIFHLGICLAQFMSPWEFSNQLPSAVFHGIFAGLFLIFYLREH